MKFVHAADLHIDSPLVGISRYEGAPVDRIRSATRRACDNLVRLCIDERAEFLLIAGDLFDGDWKDYSTGLFFIQQMNRLKQAGIRVVYVRGNHDAASHITKNLKLPDNVFELASRSVETRIFENLGVAIHGKSYARRAETTNLSHDYPDASPGYFNVGLLHTSVSGRAGHEPYAPCSLGDLRSKGYDYWALGHVHQREVLSEEPWVVFSGNLQGRHMRETGPKGATLVLTSAGVISSVEHRELDVVRFADCRLQVEADHDADQVVDDVARELEQRMREADGRTLVLRVTVSGTSAAHGAFQLEPERWENEVRSRAAEHSDMWLESVSFATAPLIDVAQVRKRKDAVGQVLRAVQAAKHDALRRAELVELFSDLNAKLPAEVREGDHGLRLSDPQALERTLDEVEQLLLVHLVSDADE